MLKTKFGIHSSGMYRHLTLRTNVDDRVTAILDLQGPVERVMRELEKIRFAIAMDNQCPSKDFDIAEPVRHCVFNHIASQIHQKRASFEWERMFDMMMIPQALEDSLGAARW